VNETRLAPFHLARELAVLAQVNLPFPMLLENLEGVVQTGLQPEIYFNSRTLDSLRRKDLKRAAREIERARISVTFHAPFMDLSPGGVDEKVREVTRLRFRQVLEMVPYFHPRVIVFHPGYDRWRFDHDADFWAKNSLRIWEPLVKRAEDIGVKIALENIFEENPSILARLLEAIPSPSFGYCLDAGHGALFSEVPIVAWIEALGSRLLEIHLHDNHGKADEHLPLGWGSIDFPAIFSALREKNIRPIYTIEPHHIAYLQPSLEALAKFLAI
jgi:sugar phosphate isomerase/epimerase